MIDGVSNTVIFTIYVGGSSKALVFNSNNNKVYCANSNSITLIDGVSNQIVAYDVSGKILKEIASVVPGNDKSVRVWLEGI